MSLWADIDDYLKSEIMTDMGPLSSYNTLQIQVVDIDDTWDLERVKKQGLFTYSFVRGFDMTIADPDDGFGDGESHTKNAYHYIWICASRCDNRRQAKRDAQDLLSRMRRFLRQRPVLNGITSDDTEQITGVTPGKTFIEVDGRLDKNEGIYLSMARLDFAVETNN